MTANQNVTMAVVSAVGAGFSIASAIHSSDAWIFGFLPLAAAWIAMAVIFIARSLKHGGQP